MGVDGLLSVTPYYNKPTQEGLYQHFKAIASAVKLPVIVYNVPGRTGVNVEPATLKRLAGLDNIYGVKEASGMMGQITRICAENERLVVLSGDDIFTNAVEGVGGHGVVSVLSNVAPAFYREAHQGGKPLSHWVTLMDVLFIESNPIPVKAALAMMGLCQPVWRLPLVPPQPQTSENPRRSRPVRLTLMQSKIEDLFDRKPPEYIEEHFNLFYSFKAALNAGAVRAAELDPAAKSGWRVNGWVKKGILLGFRLGSIVDYPSTRRGSPGSTKPLIPVSPSTRRAAFGSFPAVPPSATDAMSARVSRACRPCTSMSALMSVTERWSTRTRWSAVARRLARAATSPPPRRSAVCSNQLARCPSSSKKMSWWAATAECMKVPSSRNVRCWERYHPESLDAGVRPGAWAGVQCRRRMNLWSSRRTRWLSPAPALSRAAKEKNGASRFTHR